MKNPLISYFNQHLKITEEEEEFLTKKIKIVDIGSSAFLLKEGEVSTAFYFIIKGFIRMYYLVDGVEKTTFFYEPNDFVSSYESFTRQTPSHHYLQAVKDSTVAVFDIQVVSDILMKFPRLEGLSRLIMEDELSVYQKMIASFVTQNAEQRYLDLLQLKPHLIQEVAQYHIATYLGISPETLSRIKHRIRSKHVIDKRQ